MSPVYEIASWDIIDHDNFISGLLCIVNTETCLIKTSRAKSGSEFVIMGWTSAVNKGLAINKHAPVKRECDLLQRDHWLTNSAGDKHGERGIVVAVAMATCMCCIHRVELSIVSTWHTMTPQE